ncbi:4-hydroxythreonine-4-phosphate dehydrogenase PdxA [Klebsiella quasipneumoniae subsp. similipneumoniae]|uniref:4-hydroxythreonine-4-phosphate dehydrogenase PdxA n=1 Tax=Klebsiella quasipneumoniae TaxID=1463165 RepID=UPI0035A24C2D|nr:4-hydroxythreonine-4-phosphate dehydrogenase PdxA [Klebsiella quasipneumoniae subsp. similipneumoniae]HCF6508384.1 4-hydroxythreonine-4-phosphate dehydrogenase PdxA [Klebsiella quasipneumoniae subsp. similipneumoniae]
MSNQVKPVVAITIGDPSGIGPEIVLKALKNKSVYEKCNPLVIGNTEAFKRAQIAIKDTSLKFNSIHNVNDAVYEHGIVNVVECGTYDLSNMVWGKEQEVAGQMAMDAINKSIELGMAGEIDAVNTAPINKVAIKMTGVKQAGHTEIYWDGTKSPYVLTMFDGFNMRVFHLSRHISLINAIKYATKENVLNDLRRIHNELEALGIKNPSIAVAGINPHCGEGGLFGDEEIKEINPAIEAAKKEGINAIGPIPPDTLFARGKKGEWDAILAMYHDQGHIPCKTLDLERTVSVTLGLPFIRCSVDHGTAFDIAGKGIATDLSMVTALDATIKYAVAAKLAK